KTFVKENVRWITGGRRLSRKSSDGEPEEDVYETWPFGTLIWTPLLTLEKGLQQLIPSPEFVVLRFSTACFL
ncbi:hypothetical protein, partial [Mycobacterium tuberculosis]